MTILFPVSPNLLPFAFLNTSVDTTLFEASKYERDELLLPSFPLLSMYKPAILGSDTEGPPPTGPVGGRSLSEQEAAAKAIAAHIRL